MYESDEEPKKDQQEESADTAAAAVDHGGCAVDKCQDRAAGLEYPPTVTCKE